MAIRSRWGADAADEAAVAGTRDRNRIVGTAGDDHLVGTAGNDDFDFSAGGNDIGEGLGGNDRFVFLDELTKSDRVDGGSGSDSLFLFDAPDVVIDPTRLQSIERLHLIRCDGVYVIKDGFTGLIINGDFHGIVDASALTTGAVRFLGRSENSYEHLIGGAKGDTFFSSDRGPEVFTGGGGRDRFVYNSRFDSVGSAFDHITDFDAQDVIKLPELPGGYHVTASATGLGDVAFSYDSDTNQTLLEITVSEGFINTTIYLDGDLSFKVVHESQIVLG